MIIYRKHGLQMVEQWFDEPICRPAHADVLILRQYSHIPIGAFGNPFYSLTLDLTATPQELLQRFDSTVRYEIRRAESKDAVECIREEVVSDKACQAFRSLYDEFALVKGLPPLPMGELMARARGGRLQLSRAVYQGEDVVWHAYVTGSDCASLLYSSSRFRNVYEKETRAVIGRANKFLHWKDMVAFKSNGIKVYDFGGWYAGHEDQELLSINAFKERFGGAKAHQFNAALPLSRRGWLYMQVLQRLSAKQRKALSAKVGTLLNRLRKMA